MSIWGGRQLTQLTAARALAELTVAELADAAGVTARTVHRLEIGDELHVAERRRHGHVSREVWDSLPRSSAMASSCCPRPTRTAPACGGSCRAHSERLYGGNKLPLFVSCDSRPALPLQLYMWQRSFGAASA
jgi:hypothetical protein